MRLKSNSRKTKCFYVKENIRVRKGLETSVLSNGKMGSTKDHMKVSRND